MDRQKTTQKKLALLLPILFLFLIVSSFSVAAQPPFESAAFTTIGYIIEFPEYATLPQNEDFTFSFHLINQSNGIRLTNATSSCNFHLHSKTGGDLVNIQLPFISSSETWEILVDQGNFSRTGAHAFVTYCNESSIGGITEGQFNVTPEGNTPKNFPIALVFVIIAYVLLLFSFWQDNLMLGMFSGLLLGVLGLFALNGGIDLIRDTGTEIFAQITMWIGFISLLFYSWRLIEDAGIDLKVR